MGRSFLWLVEREDEDMSSVLEKGERRCSDSCYVVTKGRKIGRKLMARDQLIYKRKKEKEENRK